MPLCIDLDDRWHVLHKSFLKSLLEVVGSSKFMLSQNCASCIVTKHVADLLKLIHCRVFSFLCKVSQSISTVHHDDVEFGIWLPGKVLPVPCSQIMHVMITFSHLMHFQMCGVIVSITEVIQPLKHTFCRL